MNQGELFEENEPQEFNAPSDLSALYELSIEAYYAALYAQMSELPIQKEISRFVEKIKNVTSSFAKGKVGGSKPGEDRDAATKAATDRGDPDVIAVQKAAGKVGHEIHRLTGLLRFSPESDGVYTARCAPDHFILPALAEHFTLRFGETPWAIIDEKRGLCLCRKNGSEARLISWSPALSADSGPQEATSEKSQTDSWEDLWRLYHRSINNEGRKNPRLQRQLMPERYRKYLTELS